MSAQHLHAAEATAVPRGNIFAALARRAFSAQEIVLLLINAALWLYLARRSEVFWSQRNAGVLLSSVSMVTITAIGMTLLIIAREVDLSVGSMQAFVGVLAMQELNRHENLLLGMGVALLAGAVIGLI
ncbi:MAG: hypothetical protein ACR2OO_17225, partial [Thermomicrobiales bacterium]